MSSDKDRETHVYMAKLAEQAERYEGKHIFMCACVQMNVHYYIYTFN